ncbi:MAG: hypothetical protein K0R73_1468, partial [Candidatus Midichloriaceae bacterium]|nr:hypothetical protein [Candidatus Midichloriaceae bacterium]
GSNWLYLVAYSPNKYQNFSLSSISTYTISMTEPFNFNTVPSNHGSSAVGF